MADAALFMNALARAAPAWGLGTISGDGEWEPHEDRSTAEDIGGASENVETLMMRCAGVLADTVSERMTAESKQCCKPTMET